MKFQIELTTEEKQILAETTVAESNLSELLRSAVLEGNEDIILSPQTQAQIDSLNGYLDSVRGAVLAPLAAAQSEIQRQIKMVDDIVDRCNDMINKAQRSTSQRISLLTGKRGR
jgi:hypothetical protein